MVFDDVFVPWEHVFVYRNVDLVTAQFHESPAHVTANFQSLVRFGVKLEFMAGLAHKLVGTQAERRRPDRPGHAGRRSRRLLRGLRCAGQGGRALPAGQSRLRAAASPVRLRGHEPPAPAHRGHVPDGARAGGRRVPDHAVVRGQLPLARDPRPHRALLPVERHRARDRIKLIKLIWDFVGTEFGGRQLQYEMFYSAAQPVVNRRMFSAYDWTAAERLVDRLLGEY